MQTEAQALKTQFERELDPFLAMLSDRYDSMESQDWLRMVDGIRESIVKNPLQYLRSDQSTSAVTTPIIELIFDEFLESQSTAASH